MMWVALWIGMPWMGIIIYIRAISSSVPQANISDDDNLGNVLMNKVQVSAIERAIRIAQTTKTGNMTSTQDKSVDAHDLA